MVDKKAEYARKKSRKKSKVVKMKELQLRPEIAENDIERFGRQAIEWLDKNHQVRVKIKFKGRQITHPELGWNIMKKLETMLTNGKMNSPAKLVDGVISTIFMPVK